MLVPESGDRGDLKRTTRSVVLFSSALHGEQWLKPAGKEAGGGKLYQKLKEKCQKLIKAEGQTVWWPVCALSWLILSLFSPPAFVCRAHLGFAIWKEAQCSVHLPLPLQSAEHMEPGQAGGAEETLQTCWGSWAQLYPGMQLHPVKCHFW